MTVGATPTGVHVSAYRDPVSDQFVIAAINRNSYSVPVNLTMNGFWTNEVTPYVTSSTQNLAAQSKTYLQNTQTLPAQSVTTYVSRTRNFNKWASAQGAQVVSGDFTGDGKADIALAGGNGWTTIPMAVSIGNGSNTNGTFAVKNFARPDFALWANAPNAKVVAADVNRDGRDDLVVTGGPGWTTIPVALSNGDGSFSTTNIVNNTLAAMSRVQGVKVVSGDVTNDGRDDLLLVGGAGWTTIPVGISNGNGSFTIAHWSVPPATFTTWAQDPNAKPTVTDVNGDGRADIILTGGAGWTTVPVAIASAINSFTVTNQYVSEVPVWAQATGARVLSGCRRTVALPDHPSWHRCNVNGGAGGDLLGDVALVGGSGWSTIPVGFRTTSGGFSITNYGHSEFAGWAQDPVTVPVSGDFDGNGRAEIALVGGHQRWTIPIAWSYGNGVFAVSNLPVD